MSIIGSNILAGASGQADGAYLIERSLRFNDNDSASLTRTFSTNSSAKWTWSGWVKRCRLGANQALLSAGTYTIFGFNTLDNLRFERTSNATNLVTSAKFVDLSAWYHIVLAADSAQSTASDKVKLYVNGSRITSFSTATHGGPGTHINSNIAHSIGKYATSRYLDGYLADVHFIDGEQLEASDFGEYDDNNVWQAKDTSELTFGTNGFHLDFSDATNTTTIAEDSSGNSNDFTASNISVTAGSGNDSLFDSPTNGSQADGGNGGEVSGNYCCFNPLDANSQASFANGNLDWTATSGNGCCRGTIAVSSGKWYFEFLFNSGGGTAFGILDVTENRDFIGAANAPKGYSYYSEGASFTKKYHNGSNADYGASFAPGDVIGVALDMDNGTITFYKNGSSQGQAYSGVSGTFAPAVSFGSSVGSASATLNAGQRAFAYSAPSGFSPLCTTLLPDPTVADGSNYFDVDIYTGTGSSHERSEFSFSPGFVWIKNREVARDHRLFDVVRGATKSLQSTSTSVELTESTSLTSFDSDGFTVGSLTAVNESTKNHVAWGWNAGPSTVSNTDGTITSSVRANQSAGFSIVSYTGNGTAGATVGHGLNTKPDLLVVKNRDRAVNWVVYHSSVGATKYLSLNQTIAATAWTGFLNDTEPTSSVITLGDGSGPNHDDEDIIIYAMSAVAGYSSFGSYEGNNSSDGPFIHTGFKVRWLLIKNADDGTNRHWTVIDTARSTYNDSGEEPVLFPDDSSAESPADNNFGQFGSKDAVDFLSNGFKVREADTSGVYTQINRSGDTHVYIALAENPFQANGGLAR